MQNIKSKLEDKGDIGPSINIKVKFEKVRKIYMRKRLFTVVGKVLMVD